ncbi:MAG: tRNA pseudouridine(55) synthase TruB [Taibaiella sp.]|nr:tRNA pseudouridine(55) synthase TruB [Taibaiella sp.]
MKQIPSSAALKDGGVILVDKPYEWTSFDVVNKLNKRLKVKIGHAGTLDPLATGLLICCTGKFTKRITEYQKLPKEYTGIFHLGEITPTYDLESEPGPFGDYSALAPEDIREATPQFTGDILQLPPIHSAIKKGGKRDYEYARAGKEIQLEPRPVQITEFGITTINLPEVHFRVSCSTGTYIRSLAHDFGQALGCGAYLQELRRTKIGAFSVDDAFSPAELIASWHEQ